MKIVAFAGYVYRMESCMNTKRNLNKMLLNKYYHNALNMKFTSSHVLNASSSTVANILEVFKTLGNGARLECVTGFVSLKVILEPGFFPFSLLPSCHEVRSFSLFIITAHVPNYK
jgi:hypothetical protein